MAEHGAKLDYEGLTRYLRAIAEPNRLQLLRDLQAPRPLADIRLEPSRRARDRSPDRPLARQTVEAHLARLEELDLVRSSIVIQAGRPTEMFFTNPAKLHTLIEELRTLTLMRVMGESRTAPGEGSRARSPTTTTDALLLVNSPFEGTSFPLVGDGPWIIGRDVGHAISLPYDPFVSRENSILSRVGREFVVTNVPGARNGTRVNWEPVESASVSSGDVIGVGRSLLVLREVDHG